MIIKEEILRFLNEQRVEMGFLAFNAGEVREEMEGEVFSNSDESEEKLDCESLC